jgi:hypothetical protein
MEFQRDIAPPPAETPKPMVPEAEPPRPSRTGGMSFSQALAVVESHRDKVQMTLGIALIARLIGDFDFFRLARDHAIVAQLPFMGLAMLSYMIVLWFLAARTRDRWGFGMALGIGVLQATYAIVLVISARQFAPMLLWKPAVVVITHAALAYTAFRAGGAYPPLDSKKPWIFGFATAFIFVVIPWVALPLAESMGWSL